jgi:hypothetical protein
MKTRSDFSKAQLKKPAVNRKCIPCAQNGGLDSSNQSIAVLAPDSVTAATAPPPPPPPPPPAAASASIDDVFALFGEEEEDDDDDEERRMLEEEERVLAEELSEQDQLKSMMPEEGMESLIMPSVIEDDDVEGDSEAQSLSDLLKRRVKVSSNNSSPKTPPRRPLPNIAAKKSRSSASVNLKTLPPPAMLPEVVKTLSPRSSLTAMPVPLELRSPRGSIRDKRSSIPMRKSTGDLHALSNQQRSSPKLSPRPSLAGVFDAPGSSPPPPPPPEPHKFVRATSLTLPPNSASPFGGPDAPPPPPSSFHTISARSKRKPIMLSARRKSSTVIDEDLLEGLSRLKKSPPPSPRPVEDNSLFGALLSRTSTIRSAVSGGVDSEKEDSDSDDVWD